MILICDVFNKSLIFIDLLKTRRAPLKIYTLVFRGAHISISMITYAELVFGAKRSQNEQKNMIKVNHIREIYPIEELNIGVMDVFADIKVKMYAKAIRIEDMDLFIAATALYNDLTLVTNNTKHFENIPGLKLENWKNGKT